jgi:hypothetical protein
LIKQGDPATSVATREVYEARQALAATEGELRRVTGVLQTRREQAKIRLDRALEAERRLRDEYDRLVYTLRAGFGVQLGQQSLMAPEPEAGGRVTFIQKTSAAELRRRASELRRKLAEAPD